jgi:hypothetical protein
MPSGLVIRQGSPLAFIAEKIEETRTAGFSSCFALWSLASWRNILSMMPANSSKMIDADLSVSNGTTKPWNGWRGRQARSYERVLFSSFV